MSNAVLLLCAYLVGSVPGSWLMAPAGHLDIRTVGSGNVGGMNAMRNASLPAGLLGVSSMWPRVRWPSSWP